MVSLAQANVSNSQSMIMMHADTPASKTVPNPHAPRDPTLHPAGPHPHDPGVRQPRTALLYGPARPHPPTHRGTPPDPVRALTCLKRRNLPDQTSSVHL